LRAEWLVCKAKDSDALHERAGSLAVEMGRDSVAAQLAAALVSTAPLAALRFEIYATNHAS